MRRFQNDAVTSFLSLLPFVLSDTLVTLVAAGCWNERILVWHIFSDVSLWRDKKGEAVKLGILLNTARHLDDVVGISRAALSKNHQVIIFAMDEGVKLVENQALASLARLEGVSMSVCDHSAEIHGVRTEGRSPKIVGGTKIVCGSQFQNAMMNHNADRVIVL